MLVSHNQPFLLQHHPQSVNLVEYFRKSSYILETNLPLTDKKHFR